MDTLGDPYCPPRNSDETWIENGLHYRNTIPDEAELLLATQSGALDLRDYQQWVEFGWKTPIGSLESSARLAKKMNEEMSELMLAQLEHEQSPSEITSEHVLEEAGDVAWVLTAIASNGGEGITRMTRIARHPGEESQEPFTLNDLILAPIPRCEIPELKSAPLISRLKIEALTYALEGFEHHLIAAQVPLEQPKLATWGAQYADKYPYLMALLHNILSEIGLSLNQAIARNIDKISHRRITNTLDKTDPGRS